MPHPCFSRRVLTLSLFILTAPSVVQAQTNVFPTTGNVGIGTTAPRSRLDLSSSMGAGKGARLGDYLEINEREFINNALTIGWNAHIAADDGTFAPTYAPGTGMVLTMETGGLGSLDFYGKNWGGSDTPQTLDSFTHVMRLSTSGNVGIGTTSPTAKLEVSDGDAGGLVAFVHGGRLGGETMTVRTTYPAVTTNGTNYTRNLGFYSWELPISAGVADNGYRIGLDIENFVTDPNFLGTLASQFGLWARVGSYSGGSGTIQNSYGVYIENLDGPATVANKYGLYQSNETAKNYFAGNVGIGTTSPTHKLAVNGTIQAKEVIVQTGWADYVFEDDYRLAPLSEVETHIREKKHLPGIPSAAEVAEHGVSMGEMQAKLLAKVEELTLHLIAQEKRIAAQDAKLSEATAKIGAQQSEIARLKSATP